MNFHMYIDAEGKIRWRLKAKNGQIIADSGEGYHNTGNCRRAIKAFRHGVVSAQVHHDEAPGHIEPTRSSHG